MDLNVRKLEKDITKIKIEQGLKRKYSDHVKVEMTTFDKENKMVFIYLSINYL